MVNRRQVLGVVAAIGFLPSRGFANVAPRRSEIRESLARHFADAVLTAPWFNTAECTLSSRELRAIVTDGHPRDITQPMVEPPVNQDAEISAATLARAQGQTPHVDIPLQTAPLQG